MNRTCGGSQLPLVGRLLAAAIDDKGAADGELMEVTGTTLQPGDMIVKRATDELRDGSAIAKSKS